MEFKKNQTIYMQIANLICENILTAKWSEEEKISSVREMAAKIEVNPNTVMRSYSYLQDSGIIFNKRGIGYFVSEGASGKIKEMNKQTFLEQEVPEVFKKMAMLDIDMKTIEKLYKSFISSNNAN